MPDETEKREMRFEIKNLKELKKAVELISDGDRLSINLSTNFEYPRLTEARFAIRVLESGLFVHEVKGNFEKVK